MGAKTRVLSGVLGAALLLVLGCRGSIPVPDLGDLYSRAAMFEGPDRNPVVVVHGILGAKLAEAGTDRVVWGAFAGDYARPGRADGARLVALPMAAGRELHELRDDVEVRGTLDRVKVKLLGLPFMQKAYLSILGTLGVGGFRDQQLSEAGVIDYGDDHFTCFQFAYDWRRDLVENAHAFYDFLEEKRSYVQAKYEELYGVSEPVKFDIVAHSMGGLVTRYMLRYGKKDLGEIGSEPDWPAAEMVESVILVGPPNAGSVEALQQLVNGFRPAPILPRYPPAVLGTMPAIYQLLHHAPRLIEDGLVARPGEELFDPALWERLGWGLADPSQDRTLRQLLPEVETPSERRRIALDHLKKCLERADAFHAALDAPSDPPEGLHFYLFAADAYPTAAKITVDRDSGAIQVTEKRHGDGTVLRSSALGDERHPDRWGPRLESPIHWRQVHILFTDHLGLTQEPSFTDNVLYILLEQPKS